MPKINAPLVSLNAGILSDEVLSRTDLERSKFGAETMLNWFPRVLGSMTVRPGFQYLSSTEGDNLCQFIPFIKNISSRALIELTASKMRVRLPAGLLTRPTVTSAVTNGTFNANVASWTDDDEAGATSDWLTGGYMRLTGNGSAYARRYQQVTVAGLNIGVEHALRIVVASSSIICKVGTTATDDSYVNETELKTGSHSLAFTPIGDFYVTVYSKHDYQVLIDSITLEAAGIVELPTVWDSSIIGDVRFEQSEDVVFCAAGSTYRPQRIERRASGRSWSVVDYTPPDGPFRAKDSSGIELTPSASTGDISLTASREFFKPGHINALFRLTHTSQTATVSTSADNTFSASYIRVSGLTATRSFLVLITGTFVATVTLQRSFGEPGAWVDVPGETYTAPTSKTYNDALDNQIVYYRIGVKTGDYTSGTVVASLGYGFGQQTGVVQLYGITSATVAVGRVLSIIGIAAGTTDWSESEWSTQRGFPKAVKLYDGRLWWSKDDKVYGSISDAFEAFDPGFEGDAGAINRSVSKGEILWILPAQRLLVGSAIIEKSIRSSQFDAPLTPTDFSAKTCSTRGSADVDIAHVDAVGIFVQRDGRRVYALIFSTDAQDYVAQDITRLCPAICNVGVRRIAVQRQPTTRIWFVLNNGSCAVLTYEAEDKVVAWSTIETAGTIEEVGVLPGDDEDEVYWEVLRTVGSPPGPKRFVEKMAKESECTGGNVSKLMDSFVEYSGAPATSLPVAHLGAKQVVVWAGGTAPNDINNMLTVTAGAVTVANAVTSAVTGLPYTAQWKSSKLAYAAEKGTALVQRKRVDHLGMILKNTAWRGFNYGRDFTTMRQIPPIKGGTTFSANTVFPYYDADAATFPGSWSTDSRICLAVTSPYPATVVALVIGESINEHS